MHRDLTDLEKITVNIEANTIAQLKNLAKKEGFASESEYLEYLVYKFLYFNDKEISQIVETAMASKGLSKTDLSVYSKYQTGMDINEIAKELNMSEDEVKRSISYARLKFPEDTRRPFP